MKIVYLDLETTGLSPFKHQVWEAAWALESGPVSAAVLSHTLIGADPEALRINCYASRSGENYESMMAADSEAALWKVLSGATICGANPHFDMSFLTHRWGGATPWHYRSLDIQAFSMGALGFTSVPSLKDVCENLRFGGYEIPEPDHSAGGDVETVRECHRALTEIYRKVN